MSAHPTGHRSHVSGSGRSLRFAAGRKDKLVAQAKRLEAELTDEVRLPENVEKAIDCLLDESICDVEQFEREKDLRRAIAAALLRAEADGAARTGTHDEDVAHLRAQADALEKP